MDTVIESSVHLRESFDWQLNVSIVWCAAANGSSWEYSATKIFQQLQQLCWIMMPTAANEYYNYDESCLNSIKYLFTF